MVLELIIKSEKVRNAPLLMFLDAIILTLLAMLISIWMLPSQYISMAVLAFITIGAMPIFHTLYKKDSYLINYNKPFFQRHKSLILLMIFFFLGILAGYIMMYFVLPLNLQQSIYNIQFSEVGGIQQISGTITGNATNVNSPFKIILKKNLLLMLIALILIFFYGAGGLFLIAWNASILATVIVKDIAISFYGTAISNIPQYFVALGKAVINFIGYLPHGIPEILGYLIISIASAIFANDLFKGVFSTEYKWKAILDIILLCAIAVGLLVIGAAIEASYFI
jgi:hypothetical protein